MQFLRGAPPWSQFKRVQVSGNNPGVLSIGAGETTIVDVDLGNVVGGDLLLVNGMFVGTPQVGCTRLDIMLRMISGAGGALFTNNYTEENARLYNPVGAVSLRWGLHGMFPILASGGLHFGMRAASQGANTDIVAAACEVYALVLRGS